VFLEKGPEPSGNDFQMVLCPIGYGHYLKVIHRLPDQLDLHGEGSPGNLYYKLRPVFYHISGNYKKNLY